MNLNEKNFTGMREQINSNRTKNPYSFDNRNTASYLLFCLSRYIMLKQTILNNPFNSTHFAWINVCIERMGYKNLIYLDKNFRIPKFLVFRIKKIPIVLARDLELYNLGLLFFTAANYS